MSSAVKTKVGSLAYVFITGEGRNQAKEGQPAKMQYTASIITKKGSELHLDILAQINAEWENYKKAKNVKGLPDTNGIKPIMIPDPSGEIDPKTEEVRKIEGEDVIISFKTNATWENGKKKKVAVKDRFGKDITDIITSAEGTWSIGKDSLGVIHGTASGNFGGEKHKVSLYLNGIQLVKLVKYTGSDFEADNYGEAYDGEDDGMGDLEVITPASMNAEENPNI